MATRLNLRMLKISDYEHYRALQYERKGEQNSVDWFDEPGALRKYMPSWRFLKILTDSYQIPFMISMDGEEIGYGVVMSTTAGIVVQDIYILNHKLYEIKPHLKFEIQLGLLKMMNTLPVCILFDCNVPDIVISKEFRYQTIILDESEGFHKIKEKHWDLILQEDFESQITEMRESFIKGETKKSIEPYQDRYFVREAIMSLHFRRGDKNSIGVFNAVRSTLRDKVAIRKG